MLNASFAVRFVVSVALLAGTTAQVASQAPAAAKPKPFDREYTLESTMLGYRGVGGEIDGIRNPTLWALTGETVRITIVNGELMVHDIALEKLERQERADSRQGREHQHHVHGRTRATPTSARCPAIARRAWKGASTSPTRRACSPKACCRRRTDRRSTWTSRRARSRTGRPRRCVRARQGRPAAAPGPREAQRTCRARIGSAAGAAATRARARCRPRRSA